MGTECFEIARFGKAERKNSKKGEVSSFIPGIDIMLLNIMFMSCY